MGLAISQSIMRDHGGKIGFDTGADGSRFFVTLPMGAGVDGWRPVREQGSI
jgi:signal transduction histidine kinase